MVALRKLNDRELRELIKKYTAECKPALKALREANDIYWHKRIALDEIRSKKWHVMIERGRRKGRGCPAMQCSVSGYEYKCWAKTRWTYCRHVEEVFRKFCCTCCLTHSEARKKAAFNKLLGK